jgi:hypothetical protein
MMTEQGIGALPDLIEGLSSEERVIWERMYTLSHHQGDLILPPALQAQGEKYEPFLHQQIIRVTNRISRESTLFNELRARRPLEARLENGSLQEINEREGCAFCNPLEQTPADVFGRVEGQHCLTASNLAKYDALHGLLIFREHHPFVHEEERIRDFLDVAHTWFLRARQHEPDARYPFFMWNCLWRAGASVIHGHAQLLLSSEPYHRVREWLRCCEVYRQTFNAEYGEDMYRLHHALGLGRSFHEGMLLCHLTPVKEKEVVILARSTRNLAPLISRVLSSFHRLGVCSFNLAILQPPLDEEGFVMVRVVDRGDLLSRSSDIGGMELYGGMAVVSSDPFRVMDTLEKED